MFKKFFNVSKNSKKKIIALAAAAAVVLSPIGAYQYSKADITVKENVTIASASTRSTAYYDGLTDGAILHCFSWNFETIKANLSNIANAGYTAIQTSPINACAGAGTNMKLMGNSNNGSDGAWWWHYQPTDWTIGNYQLGSRDQFKELCAAAESYGLKVIVDVVPNHTTPNINIVSQSLKNAAGGNLYHSTGFSGIAQWGDRIQCTRYMMGGLADVDTENAGFQNYFISFLNDCIACGADGFRYDTAKHIALPDDPAPSGVYNNFWIRVTTEITNASSIFNYGEVLQGDNDRASSYVEMIGSTCTSSYGANVRNAVRSMNLNTNNVMNYGINASTKNLVTWVESHDNYINDGTWSQLDDTQIKLAWAVITARKDGIPLFFDRPMNGGPSNMWGNNVLGAAGSDLYRDDEVVAVNKFRTAMAGYTENLRNPNGDSNVLMVERGNAGVVIINSKYNDYNINSTTNLANGTYVNQTDNNNRFTVSNGVITGTVPSRGIAVLSMVDPTPTPTPTPTPEPGTSIDVYFEKPDNWVTSLKAYVYNESGSSVSLVSAWPGITMTNVSGSTYKATFPSTYDGAKVIFNDTNNQTPGQNQAGYTIKADGLYNVNGYKGQYVDPTPTPTPTPTPETNEITLYYKTTNSSEYVHYKIGNGSWTTAPGVAMSNASVSGYKTITIDLGTETTLKACFNNGNGSWDNNGGSDYTFSYATSDTFTIADGKVTAAAPGAQASTTVTIYYQTGWTNANIHYQLGNGSWTQVPGVAMSNSSVSGYKTITIDLGTQSGMTFCFNNGNGTWDSRNGGNYTVTSAGTYTVSGNAVRSGAPN